MRFGGFSLFLVTSTALSLIACGGGSPPATPKGAAEAGAESFAEVNPADLAELDAGSAKPQETPPVASASASSAPAPSSALPPAEPKDECTPVGIDFEKRARPQLKACYAEGKKKEPNLMGTVRITVDIDTLGKVKSIKITEKTLPDPVAQCMLKVVKTTTLAPTDAAKCPGKSLTIPVTFPTPH